jgi:hypothetical protein
MAKKSKTTPPPLECGQFYRVTIPFGREPDVLYCCPTSNNDRGTLSLLNNELIEVCEVYRKDEDDVPLQYIVKNSYGEEVYLSASYSQFLELVNMANRRRRR